MAGAPVIHDAVKLVPEQIRAFGKLTADVEDESTINLERALAAWLLSRRAVLICWATPKSIGAGGVAVPQYEDPTCYAQS